MIFQIIYQNAAPTTMLERTELVTERCKELQVQEDLNSIETGDIPRKLLVSDRYRLIGCKAAKVAGTNLQRIFYVLEKFTNNSDTGQVKKKDARHKTESLFLNSTLEEMKYRLVHYKKFMLVRHPLERLVSAYRDSKPLQLFRVNTRPSFRKYVMDVLQTPNLTRPAIPISTLCKPCLVKYDFVGSLNNFDGDLEEILTEVGANHAVTIPHRNETGYTKDKSSSVVWEYYKDIPINLIEQIEKYFETDYFHFGFSHFRETFKIYKNSSDSEIYQ